jgi:hypothetical protein
MSMNDCKLIQKFDIERLKIDLKRCQEIDWMIHFREIVNLKVPDVRR